MADKYKPDDDFESEIDSGDFDERINTVEVNNLNEQIEIQNEQSQLASTPGKNIIILIVAGLVSVYVIYSIAFKKDPNDEAKKKLEEITKSQPVQNAVPVPQEVDALEVQEGVVAPDIKAFDDEQAPVLSGANTGAEDMSWPLLGDEGEEKPVDNYTPDLIETEEPKEKVVGEEPPIFVAPVLTEEAEVEAPLPSIDNAKVSPGELQLAQIEEAKRKQPMLLKNGGGSPSKGTSSGRDGLELTPSETVKATFIGDTDTMLAQGKLIDVVLETAINTNLEGVLRAVVSRNVYAESGRNILIPKGSRLIGSYGAADANSSRVAIVWKRVIMPDGVDVHIESPGTDVMGRAGITGFIDRKFFDIFSNAILLSVVTIAGAAFVDEVTDAQEQTRTTTTSGTTGDSTTSSSGTSTDAAVLDSVSNISDIASSITEGLLDDRPTIIVQQGTKMKVFVNKDVHFPSSVASRVQFIN